MTREVSDNDWFERGVRLGLVAYGVVHLLIAWLALQLAFGDSAGAPSQQGAMHELAQKPFGEVLLWVVALGFVCLVVWQADRGRRRPPQARRAQAHVQARRCGGKAVIYARLRRQRSEASRWASRRSPTRTT